MQSIDQANKRPDPPPIKPPPPYQPPKPPAPPPQPPPRPSLRPAFDEREGKAVKVFGEKIWKKVGELAKK